MSSTHSSITLGAHKQKNDIELSNIGDPALDNPHFALSDRATSAVATAIEAALEAANAELALFDPGADPHAASGSGFKRDLRATSIFWRIWGLGRQVRLGQTPCRVSKGTPYSVGVSSEELLLLRMQIVAVPLVIACMMIPLAVRPLPPPILSGYSRERCLRLLPREATVQPWELGMPGSALCTGFSFGPSWIW